MSASGGFEEVRTEGLGELVGAECHTGLRTQTAIIFPYLLNANSIKIRRKLTHSYNKCLKLGGCDSHDNIEVSIRKNTYTVHCSINKNVSTPRGQFLWELLKTNFSRYFHRSHWSHPLYMGRNCYKFQISNFKRSIFIFQLFPESCRECDPHFQQLTLESPKMGIKLDRYYIL